MSKIDNDAFGRMLLTQHRTGKELCEIIEREDNYIDTGSVPGQYFFDYGKWSPSEKQAARHARGRILDIGCGAGRHSIYFQEKGFDVVGIDNSPGAIKVCKSRGLKKAFVRGIEEISKFKNDSFETVLMMGNNFGLMGSSDSAKRFLSEMWRITTDGGRIIAATRNPHGTTNPDHLRYHKLNKKRGRLPGQLKIRARFGITVGEWFEYLLVSPKQMEAIVKGTGWKIEKLFGEVDDNFYALLTKNRP